MDPVTAVGLTASVLQVAVTAVKTVHGVEQLIHKLHTAPKSADALFSESSVVSATLSHLVELFERKDNSLVTILRAKPELSIALDRALSGCIAVYTDLEKELKKILPPSFSDSSEKLNLRRRTSLIWKDPLFKDYLAKIHGHQSVLLLLLQALQVHSLSDISRDTKMILADMSQDRLILRGSTSTAPSYTSEVEASLEEKVTVSEAYRRIMGKSEDAAIQKDSEYPTPVASVVSEPRASKALISEPIVPEPVLAEPVSAEASTDLDSRDLELIDLTEKPSILDSAIEEQVSPALNDLLSLDASFGKSTTPTSFRSSQRDSTHSTIRPTPGPVLHGENDDLRRRTSSVMTPLSPEGPNGGFFGPSPSAGSSNGDSLRSASLQSEFLEVVANEEPPDPFPAIDCPPASLPLSTKDEMAHLQKRRQDTMRSQNVRDELDWAEEALHFISIGSMYRDRISRLQSKPTEAALMERIFETDAKHVIETHVPQGNAKALFLKGMYFGLKVAASTDCYMAALSKGYLRAAFYIGMMYESNQTVSTAVKYYIDGAVGGDSACKYRLAQAYLGGELGLKKDHKKAIDYLQKAAAIADADFPQALFLLAVLQTESYRKNSKLSKSILPIDEIAAKDNFIAAALLGCSKSQLRLGHAYGAARLGLPKNPLVALHYLRLAARQGEPDAELQISTWFGWGQPGILEPNEKLAFVHARRAAAADLVPALCQVGYFYELGIGVEKDKLKAKQWYLKAAARGDETAQKRLDSLRQRGSFGSRT